MWSDAGQWRRASLRRRAGPSSLPLDVLRRRVVRAVVTSASIPLGARSQTRSGVLAWGLVKYVVRYEVDPANLPKAMELFDEHKARWSGYADAGTLLAIGPFSDPSQGALGVFTTREAAEEFVAGDPFVTHGVVTSWEVWEWNEVLRP
jgi:uncharacterized protein YciI